MSSVHLESLTDRLDWPAAPLICHRHAWARVVKVGGDVELQQRCELTDDVLWGPVLLLLLQATVGLDDLRQLVCQVVLTPASSTLCF